MLIHGDAAFPGQGIVAETLNLARLDGYDTGGTIHIIVNNQLGFTATSKESYGTSYSSGLARGFKIPIIHVNADDPIACIEAARLASAYRAHVPSRLPDRSVGYRRHGHNEGDEPASRSRCSTTRSPRIRRCARSGPTDARRAGKVDRRTPPR